MHVGRHTIKQYIPSKKAKYGIKAWILADARTGYLSHINIYTGKQNRHNNDYGEGYQVVMNVCQPLFYSNRIVYFDNYFTSIKLLIDLAQLQLYAVGTVRKDRKGLPQV